MAYNDGMGYGTMINVVYGRSIVKRRHRWLPACFGLGGNCREENKQTLMFGIPAESLAGNAFIALTPRQRAMTSTAAVNALARSLT
jgi:hypothetical protein